MASELSILTEVHPNDWEIRKIKYVFDERRETNDPVKTDVLISLTHDRGVIPHSEKGDIGNKEKDDLTKYKLVYPGDIVVNSMNVIIGSAGLSNYYGLVSPVYYMLTARDPEADKKFFHYLFRSVLFQKSLVGVGSGILEHRMRISMEKLGSHFIPVPPAKEQRLISRYLDKKTQQIDTLIEKIEKKIELLKEQRTSLINHYVTKGLDPNVEMKDSGVEWIGKIPKHWEIKRNKSFLTLKRQIVGEGWRNYRLLSLGKAGVTIRDIESGKGKFPESFETYQLVNIGDFIFCLFDMDETPRTVGLSNIFGMITGAYSVFECSNEVNSNFVFYYYLVLDDFKGLKPYYSGLRKTIRPTKFLSLYLHLPPRAEQDKIVDLIKNELDRNLELIKLEQQRVFLLEEYRQSLISSVVTGKVRVTEDMV